MSWKRVRKTEMSWTNLRRIMANRGFPVLCVVDDDTQKGSVEIRFECAGATLEGNVGQFEMGLCGRRTPKAERAIRERLLRLTEREFFPEMKVEFEGIVDHQLSGDIRIETQFLIPSGRSATDRAMEVFVSVIRAVADGKPVDELPAPEVEQETYFLDREGKRKTFGEFLAERHYESLRQQPAA